MKVAIIGAGIAGLSAGCYLRMNGFETEIFEMHSRAGGLCTNWKRGDYTFNGCIHWLLGSNISSPFYQLWSELIDLSSIRFITHEFKMEIETQVHRDRSGNNKFRLYTNIGHLESYMLDLAPEDEKVIRKFIRQIRRIQEFEIPPMIKSVPQLLPWKQKAVYIKYLPLLFFLNKYRKITNFTFADKLKNPFLKECFQLLFDGADLPLLIHTIPLAFQDKMGAGYPVGGSDVISEKIEEKYLSLGGVLHFNSPVQKILVQEDIAAGVMLKDGRQVAADFVISAADWRFTLFSALEGRYTDRTILSLLNGERLKPYYSMFLLSLGLDRSFDAFPHLFRFPLESVLVSPDGTKYERMEMHIHKYDPTLAPTGKSVVSVNLYTRNGAYWIQSREQDKEQYNRVKKELANKIIDILEKKVKGIRENIEEISIATPATFQRYTNNWQGSIQGWLPGKNMVAPSPVKPELPGLKRFYLAGHWTMPGGGLPIAIKSARDVAMMICDQAGKEFTTIPV